MKKLILAALMVVAAGLPLKVVHADDDVFLDEGDGGFDTMAGPSGGEPTLADDPFASEAPASKSVPKAASKVAAPAAKPAAKPVVAAQPAVVPTVPKSASKPAAKPDVKSVQVAQPAPVVKPEGKHHVAPEAKPAQAAQTAPAPAPAASASTVAQDEAVPFPREEQTQETSAPKAKKHYDKYAGGAYMTTTDSCPMMRGPASVGAPMVVVKPAKKIWIEESDPAWVKAYNKAGEPGYLSKDCFK
jgi:hypothetical protein